MELLNHFIFRFEPTYDELVIINCCISFMFKVALCGSLVIILVTVCVRELGHAVEHILGLPDLLSF